MWGPHSSWGVSVSGYEACRSVCVSGSLGREWPCLKSVCTGLVQVTLVMNFALVSVSAEEYAGEVNVCV